MEVPLQGQGERWTYKGYMRGQKRKKPSGGLVVQGNEGPWKPQPLHGEELGSKGLRYVPHLQDEIHKCGNWVLNKQDTAVYCFEKFVVKLDIC